MSGAVPGGPSGRAPNPGGGAFTHRRGEATVVIVRDGRGLLDHMTVATGEGHVTVYVAASGAVRALGGREMPEWRSDEPAVGAFLRALADALLPPGGPPAGPPTR